MQDAEEREAASVVIADPGLRKFAGRSWTGGCRAEPAKFGAQLLVIGRGTVSLAAT